MKHLRRMMLRQFMPIFIVALVFFILLLQLIDVFGNIWKYFAHDVSARQVAWIALLYVPKCISFALPVSFLFAISYTLGLFYANNELFAIFCSGVSLYRLVLPFIVIGLALSVGGFFFEDQVVISTYQRKNQEFQRAIKQTVTLSQSNVIVTSPDQRIVYAAEYYNDVQRRLNGLTVVVRGEDKALELRIDADTAEWRDSRWILKKCRVFSWDPATQTLSDENRDTYESPLIVEPPETFRRMARSVEEMDRAEAARYVAMIRKAGLDNREVLTTYYRKFSFACTPFIVAFLASSLGGAFKKNILLMSLLSALVLSVGYYVAQMVTSILSKNGLIMPLTGAWAPFVIFMALGFLLFRAART
jgi:lipopolysaccharide export system permease protein